MALNNMPLAGQTLATTRDPIAANFNEINNAFTVDHFTYNSAAFIEGKHNKVTFPESAADPATLVNEVALYSKQSAFTASAELFIRKESSGSVYEFTSCLAASPGWSRLPSGILLKWGNDISVAGLGIYTFPVGANIPAFTQIFNILVTTSYNNVADGNGFVRLNHFFAPWTQFQVYGSQRTTTTPEAVGYTYLAIGI